MKQGVVCREIRESPTESSKLNISDDLQVRYAMIRASICLPRIHTRESMNGALIEEYALPSVDTIFAQSGGKAFVFKWTNESDLKTRRGKITLKVPLSEGKGLFESEMKFFPHFFVCFSWLALLRIRIWDNPLCCGVSTVAKFSRRGPSACNSDKDKAFEINAHTHTYVLISFKLPGGL